MATASSRDLAFRETAHPVTRSEPAYQAYRILHVAFVLVPLVAGADKFLEWLADWDMYLSPPAQDILGRFGHEFMLAVGVIEIAAGIGVALWPRAFAWVVAAWLGAIIINLLLSATFYDIALRDFGLMLGALALGRLAAAFGRSPEAGRRSAI
jgi:hypothetical protein